MCQEKRASTFAEALVKQTCYFLGFLITNPRYFFLRANDGFFGFPVNPFDIDAAGILLTPFQNELIEPLECVWMNTCYRIRILLPDSCETRYARFFQLR